MSTRSLRHLGEITSHHARLRPDATAMVFGERVTSYAELDQLALHVAAALCAAGLKAGDRIAYLGKNSDLFIQLLFGAAKAGQVMVPLNWRLAVPELEVILNDAGNSWLFVEPEFLAVAQAVQPRCPRLQTLLPMQQDEFSAWRDLPRPAFEPRAIDPEDVVLQMYTSGTTGKPKGVMTSHRSIFAQRRMDESDPHWLTWTSEDNVLMCMPSFHISGTGWAVEALCYGARVIIHPTPVADAILEDIEKYRLTRLLIVPAVLQMVLDARDRTPRDLSSVRTLYYGAAPISAGLLQRSVQVLHCGFVQLYGMTEIGGVATRLPSVDHSLEGNARMLSCGTALPETEIQIRDVQGHAVAAGQPGEIWIKTPSIMNGYWNLPKASAEVLRDGWYASGDAGYLDADGYLFLLDRTKDMIISGGENIYPSEVEAALHRHPLVREAAVIGVPDPKWGEAVKAIVVLRDAGLDEAGLIRYLREQLAGYKLPKSVDFVEALPRNPSGKVLKRELRLPYWQGRERAIN